MYRLWGGKRIHFWFVSSAEKRKIIRKPRVGVQRFAQQRELQRRPQTNTAHKGGAPHSEENKADILIKVLVFDFDYIEYWIEYVKVYHYMLYLKWFDLGLIKICFVGGCPGSLPRAMCSLMYKRLRPKQEPGLSQTCSFPRMSCPHFSSPCLWIFGLQKKEQTKSNTAIFNETIWRWCFILRFVTVQSEPRCRFPAAHCLLPAESEPSPSERALRPLDAYIPSLVSTTAVRLLSLCTSDDTWVFFL